VQKLGNVFSHPHLDVIDVALIDWLRHREDDKWLVRMNLLNLNPSAIDCYP
jgi:hypothetical protein